VPSNDSLAGLRRIAVLVVLALLVLVVGADVLDGIFGHDTFHVDVGLYTLIGGIVLGVLGAEAVSGVRK
jgi:hypothetical protein